MTNSVFPTAPFWEMQPPQLLRSVALPLKTYCVARSGPRFATLETKKGERRGARSVRDGQVGPISQAIQSGNPQSPD
jgi:hypothetical protein